MRDPLYKKIVDGLEGPLDRKLFEECVVDLLRDAFPTLVPIHGGRDAGMDGAIADGEGEPYPLIVTTDQSPIRNLTKSLESYRTEKGERARSRVVFVTSRELTPTQRRNLEDRAQEKGFTLVQVFERRGLADRLYRDPGWRRKLLGLPGDPPALSAVPRTRRPLIELEPVGREADLEWLRTTHGDRLLYGEPGSGKTFLLLQLVREGRALFLASEDWAEIADAVREQQPEIIILDDAHLDPEQLDRLRQVRQDIDAEFEILATCWVGEKEQVAAALGGPAETNMHRLELLTRKEIWKVLARAGVRATNRHVEELIDQSANKPGLAVTLANLWLRGDWQEVLTGQALRRSLIGSLTSVLGGEDPTLLLASFALGGDRGMTLGFVAEATGWNRAQIWDLAVRRIAASGVLVPREEEALAVEPRALRFALLKEVFFCSRVPPFEYRTLVEKAPSTASAVENLVEAAHRLVPVPRDDLRELLERTESVDAWRHFAQLGEEEALWVLDRFPHSFSRIAEATLRTAPSAAIQRSFQELDRTHWPWERKTEREWDVLRTWVQEIPITELGQVLQKVLERRRLLLREAEDYHQRGGNPGVTQRVLFTCMSPSLHGSELSPLRDKTEIRWGLLPAGALASLKELWESHRHLIMSFLAETWAGVSTLIRDWTRPRPDLTRKLSPEDRQRMKTFARKILEDLAPLTADQPGYAAGLKRLAEQAELDLEIGTDPEFEVLFPPPATGRKFGKTVALQVEAARELAAKWLEEEFRAGPSVKRLVFLEQEAQKIQATPSFAALEFCRVLAAQVEPVPWISSAVGRHLSATLVGPFLERAMSLRSEGLETLVLRCLTLDDYRVLAADLVLRLPQTPPSLLERALERLGNNPRVVQDACQGGEVPRESLHRLLRHPSNWVAIAAAIGEWLCEPEKSVRPELEADWRAAILRAKSREYREKLPQEQDFWFQGILQNDSELALDWLKSRLKDQDLPRGFAEHGLFAAAVAVLNPEQKLQVLADLEVLAEDSNRRGFVGQLLELLVDSPDLYENLLASSRLEYFYLTPLDRPPWDESWCALARFALDAGLEPRQVAEHSFYIEHSYARAGVEHWTKWETAFAEMEKTAEGPLLEVARHGLRIAREKIEGAKQKQRHYELTGHY